MIKKGILSSCKWRSIPPPDGEVLQTAEIIFCSAIKTKRLSLHIHMQKKKRKICERNVGLAPPSLSLKQTSRYKSSK